mmetsp:Transcript_23511/g.76621  ORF Transcript_23511/g.76621 Transcript_23511/m.76621 type:complete len:115 (-) Transcript_23511:835-1179(-)
MERTSITVPKPPKRNVIRIKIISMGDAGCGKSCLIKRYCEEKFVSKYISTIGVDYGVKSVVVSNQQVQRNWEILFASSSVSYHDILSSLPILIISLSTTSLSQDFLCITISTAD